MSLRLRLALGLAALLFVGLAVFGIATYSFYAPTQYAQLDTQLKSSVFVVSATLEKQANLTPAQPNRSKPADESQAQSQVPSGPEPTAVLAPGSFAELVSPKGAVVAEVNVESSTPLPKPKLPPVSQLRRRTDHIFTTDSVGAGPEWRVLVTAADGAPGYLAVIAVPTTAVAAALRHLVVVEIEVAVGLLLLLVAGAWAILRRGLSPLEHMAQDSRAIAAGDLSRRVGPEKGPSEVIELGAALNAMLSDIEHAFAERDVTEARLRQFLADASHELRTPLTSIQGFAELFRLNASRSERNGTAANTGAAPREGADAAGVLDQVAIARRIEDESRRMKRLVDDLLLLARLDQEPEMVEEEADLSVIAADACTAAVASEPGRPIALDAPVPVSVFGDRNYLRQAVGNLLSNALKHTPRATAVEVSVRLEGAGTKPEAVVSVRDHGPGLDEAALAHVFDRFWRADTARSGDGAGLGLAIVAAIVAEHGGRVEAANAAGGGAVFTIRLPARGERGDERAAATATGEPETVELPGDL